MKTVTKIFTSELKERGSRFIGYLFPAKSEEEFDKQLQHLKTELWDASHHCYGYRIGATNTIEFSSDDGEPSGTAGLPVLNQLKSYELVDVGAVVVRYFGGTKLGKSGLIEFYGKSALLAIENSNLRKIKKVQFVKINYPYSLENQINKLILDYELVEQKAEYLADVSKLLACPIERNLDFKKSIKSLEHLSVSHEMLHKCYIYI